MELVSEDGKVIRLQEGEIHELGRGSEFDAYRDQSVSRLHVIVELLRPASRKGKEVVGKSTALKLHIRVVGRNPICITSGQGPESINPPRIKFAGKGEVDWLAPGDKFALSIRRPSFFVLRQFSGGDEVFAAHSVESTPKPVENHVKSSVEQSAIAAESNSLEEEEGIARAVARRQHRRLERDLEQQRMRLGGLEDTDAQVKPDSESHDEESVVPCQTNFLCPNPVSEFGFIVKGSEFLAYEKQNRSESRLAWSWKTDKKGDAEEDAFEGKHSNGKSKKNKRFLDKQEEEDEEWGGDNEEEERVSKALRWKAKRNIPTRSSRSNPPTFRATQSNRPERASENGEDSSDVSAEDSDSIDDDDEDESRDDDDTVSDQTGKKPANREKQKPACRYGSQCYRKNPQHLLDFSHPQRKVGHLDRSIQQPSSDVGNYKPDQKAITQSSTGVKTRIWFRRSLV